MPDFMVANLSELKAQRLISEVDDAALEVALKRLAESQRTFTPKAEGEDAADRRRRDHRFRRVHRGRTV